MTFKDFISKKNLSNSTDSSHRVSSNDEIKKKHHHHNNNNHKLKQLHVSVLDLLHWHPPTDDFKNKNIQQQQGENDDENFPHRSSIIKSTDVPRMLSKKSVTFASAFDFVDNKHDTKQEIILNLQSNEMSSEEDLVTIIPNKQFIDGSTIDTNENIEPYPFRSEVPLSQSNSINDDTTNSDHSSKKIIHHFVHHHRPKKLRHPIQITDSVSTINRSTSAPNLLISSSLSQPSTTNDQQRRSKGVRTWFKLSTVGRFVQLFNKKSQQNQTNNVSNKKSKFRSQSSELRRLSELLY